jgi:hypothetical protein
LRALVPAAAALTVAAVLVLVLRTSFTGLAVRIWLIGMGALALWSISGAALERWEVLDPPRASMPRFWRHRPRPERLRQLETLEHAVDFSQGTAFDLHFRLRPHMVRIAEHRLAVRGVNLGAQPARAQAMVGPEAWELVRPDRPEPENRSARGARMDLIKRAVEQLDEI